MKKILIPTDFSKVTKSALTVATEIARKTSAEVELLHIIEAPNDTEFSAAGELLSSGSINDVFILKSIEVAQKKIKKIVDDVNYVGVRFRPKIKVGSPSKHFTKYIVKEPADLIIMGTEGTEGYFDSLFNNSNTDKVVNKADCMVLSVKKGIEDFKIRNVVFASTFEEDSPAFVKGIQKLQQFFDFRIHLIYVNPAALLSADKEEVKEKEKEFVEAYKLEDYEFHILDDITEYNGITNYAKNVNADIIAISTHQRKGLNWLGGVSDDLVNYADTPVLTYKVD